jgi:hypothetical protein
MEIPTKVNAATVALEIGLSVLLNVMAELNIEQENARTMIRVMLVVIVKDAISNLEFVTVTNVQHRVSHIHNGKISWVTRYA